MLCKKIKKKLQNFHQDDGSLLGFGVELGEVVELVEEEEGDMVEEEK